MRDETVAADCRLLDSALNSTLARWLTEWNFAGAAQPRIVRDASPPEDLDARAKREQIVASTTGLKPTQAHIEATYGGEWEQAPAPAPAPPGAPPEDEDEDEDEGGDEEPPEGEEGEDVLAALAVLARARASDTISDAVTRLVMDEWEPQLAPVIEPLLQAAGEGLERGESLAAFRERLPNLFAVLDDAPLIETLGRMGFSAGALRPGRP